MPGQVVLGLGPGREALVTQAPRNHPGRTKAEKNLEKCLSTPLVPRLPLLPAGRVGQWVAPQPGIGDLVTYLGRKSF